MPLLKDQNAKLIQSEAVVFDFGDLRAAADKLKAEARAEADRILAEARAEAKRLTDNAAAEGRAAGHAEGTEQGHAEGRASGHAEALQQTADSLVELQQAWVNAARQWDEDRKVMVLDAKQSLLQLALELAHKIVHRLPELDPSLVVDQVAAAVDHIAHPSDATIQIHPDSHALVAEALPQLIETTATLNHVHLQDNAELTPGSCVVTYGRGRASTRPSTPNSTASSKHCCPVSPRKIKPPTPRRQSKISPKPRHPRAIRTRNRQHTRAR